MKPVLESWRLPSIHGSAVYISLLSMVRTPKHYADTMKDPLVMEDETCARIMEATEHDMGQKSMYISSLWSGPPSTTRTH